MSRLLPSFASVVLFAACGLVCQPATAQDAEAPAGSDLLKPTATIEEPVDPETLAAKASYILGFNTASRMVGDLQQKGIDVDKQQMLKGIEDSMLGKKIAFEQEEIRAILTAYQEMLQKKQLAKLSKASEENKAAGDAFRKENGAKEGVKELDSGIQYEVLTEGAGPALDPAQEVMIDYRGMFTDGTTFDSSLDAKPGRPAQPMKVSVSGKGMIPGFGAVLPMMKVGSKWRVTIPPEMAYQVRGSGPRGPIGPNETLVFEIDVKNLVDEEVAE